MLKKLLELIPKGPSQKLGRDIGYTLGSFFVLAISGIIINVVITGVRDTDSLGVFNQAYAIYIVASQFAVLGIHYSVLRHAPVEAQNLKERGALLGTAIFLTLLLGLTAAAIVYHSSSAIGRFFDSEMVGKATSYAAFGLVFFPLNKVFLFYLNGLRHMRIFSVLQALRYIVVMLCVTYVAFSDLGIDRAALSFVIAETITSLLALSYIVKAGLAQNIKVSGRWITEHFRFGLRGLLAGMFAEFNSRVDVLVIGLFLEDREVGIYSFAAMLVDGLYHVLAMIRINFNPLLTMAHKDNNWTTAIALQSKARRYLAPVMVALSACVIIAYLGFDHFFVEGDWMREDGLPVLLILLAGLVVVSPLIPFDNLMLVSGHPGYQTAQQMCTVLANIVFALLLLPVFGIAGAALGTVTSYFANVTALILFSKKLVDWDILRNRLKSKEV